MTRTYFPSSSCMQYCAICLKTPEKKIEILSGRKKEKDTRKKKKERKN